VRPPGSPRRAASRGDCRARLAELFAYLDDELSPARCAVVERHLAGCACCGRLVDRLRSTIQACRAAGREHLPAAARQRARKRIEVLLAGATPPRRRA
jgi:anti-sigma factor RsiW